MEQILINIALNIGLFLVLIGLLRISVMPKSKRHFQFLYPIILVIIWLIYLIISIKNGQINPPSKGYFSKYILGFSFLHPSLKSIVNLLLFFAILKGFLRSVFTKLLIFFPSMENWSFAYRNIQNIYLLKRGFHLPRQMAMYSVIGLTILSIIFLILLPIDEVFYNHIPFLLIIPASILLEIFWYLDGEMEGNPYSLEFDNLPDYNRNIGFYKIWKEYQETWPGNFLISWAFSSEKSQNTEEKYENVLKELNQKNDLILLDSIYKKVSDSLFKQIKTEIARQNNVLIIVARNIKQKSNNQYHNSIKEWVIENIPYAYEKVEILNPVSTSNLENARVIIASVNDILDAISFAKPEVLKWFDDLSLILCFKSQDIFSEGLMKFQSLLFFLKSYSQKNAQLVFLAESYFGIQSAIQVNFPINKKYVEMEGFENLTRNVFFLLWKEENNQYQSAIQKSTSPNFIGILPILSVIVLKNKLDSFKFIGSKKAPLLENIEEYDNEINKLKPIYRMDSDGEFTPGLQSLSLIKFENELQEEKENNIFFIYDEDYNFITSFLKWRLYAVSNVLINLVSPTYLLRDFFADNIQYFETNPIKPFAPVLSNSSISTLANEVLIRLTLGSVTQKDLLTFLQPSDPSKVDLKFEIIKLFESGLGLKMDLQWLEILETCEFQPEKNDFVIEYSYKINRAFFASLPYLKPIHFVDNNNEQYLEIDADFIYQRYIPGQKHVIYNRYYVIEKIDINSGICLIRNEENVRPIFYRHHYALQYEGASTSAKTLIHNDKILLKIVEGKYTVKTLGYNSFSGAISFKTFQDFSYNKSSQIPLRNYPKARTLIIDFFENKLPEIYNASKIVKTIQALLFEILPTLFPKTYYYGIVLSDQDFQNKNLKQYFPILRKTENTSPDINESLFQIYIVEDSHQDVGIVGALSKGDNLEILFELIISYLEWISKSLNSKEDIGEILGADYDFIKNKNLQSEFLKYGMETYAEDFDMPGTLKFLKEKFGENERIILETSNNYKRVSIDNKCDFCGKHISDGEFSILFDGRERCKECDKKGIDTHLQLLELYNEVKKDYFSDYRKLSLPTQIDIKLVDSSYLMQQLGLTFQPSSEFDIRSVGLASINAGKFSILIENGFDAEKIKLTIIHELTHIFQYSNLNYKKMKEISGDLHIEGHACWAEIDYLYYKNRDTEASALMNSILSRPDKYGTGLSLIKTQYLKGSQSSLLNVHEMMIKDFPN